MIDQSKQTPKIFIGTLEHGESEFEECLESIQKQQRINFEHKIIRNLPEHKAHKFLFDSWEKVRQSYDAFVKIDADNILIDSKGIFNMYQLMKEKMGSGIQVRCIDYFSKQLVPGPTMFSTQVEFKRAKRKLFPDHVDSNHSRMLKNEEVLAIEPIGFHAKYPNPRQSFFYGFHRELKGQRDLINNLYRNWIDERDEARRWAVIGALDASKFIIMKWAFDSRFVFYRYSKLRKETFTDQVIVHEFEKIYGFVS